MAQSPSSSPFRLALAFVAVLLAALLPAAPAALADATAQTLPFSQNWTNIGLITANDNWSGVPGIEGFRGDNLTAVNDVDPQTVLAGDDPGVLDVNANQTNPNTFATGGVTEFHITDPVVALTGSGTADAPYIRLYLNTTGQSGVTIAYNLRDIDGSADNAAQQVALHFRVGNSGNFTNVATAYVADSTTGGVATLVTPVCVVLPPAANNQPLVQVRVMTTNATGNDEWVGIDDIVVDTAGCGPPPLTLSIDDVAVTEGDAGTVTATFTVGLSAPAGPGGVTFDIATADGTAQDDNPPTEDDDYEPNSLTGQTIPAGSSTYAFNVTVNGDTAVEANETFFVDVTNVVGATVPVGQGQGQGTINNDDVALTPIHDIQGPGAASPIPGASVTTRGIVTGIKSNGFFIQEPDATVDADPQTSEGILVFTSSAPAGSIQVGDLVQVTGTVFEFVPTQDPLQPPLTELTSPTVVEISAGNPLPAPIPLSATFPDPAGVFDQLERAEGMRVSVASLTVTGPTLGNINEPNATATSSGVFYGVVTGVPRPFREEGIQQPDPPPAGTIPPIPRFDSNPERIRVDSDGQVGGAQLDVSAGAVVTGLVGPLDYSFRTYTIQPDPASPPVVVGGATATAVAMPTAHELTVASFNLQRFFDDVNDPGVGEPVLTATAYANRRNKASIAIRQFLQTPDIIGVVEMENLSTLQALAATINADAVSAGDPDPEYDAFLAEGNDVGGIDVGFLVKTAVVAPAVPRVEVVAVTQEGLGTLITNPDASTELLNDRPPLVLEAIVHHPNGASFPLTVIVNHLRSLNGVGDLSPGPNGWATVGDRVRNKRQLQAEFLADLVQARQIADSTESIFLVGDFNAFEVNDGFGDSMNVITGTPVPDNETAVPGDGVDLVDPDLDNLFDTAPALERYSFIFDGNAQSLDHVVANAPLLAATSAARVEHPRINADFAETARNTTTNAIRVADHDPIVAFFEVPAFGTGDLTITKADAPDPVAPGGALTYTIVVANGGPDDGVDVTWSDLLPAETTFLALTAAAGWTCSTPAVGAGGTVSCSIASFAAAASDNFSLDVLVDAAATPGSLISNTATVDSVSGDSDPSNNSATASTTVATIADLTLEKSDDVDPVAVGANLVYTIAVSNEGPASADSVAFSDPLPAGTNFVSLVAPAGWSCTTPPVGTNGGVNCTIASLPPGGYQFVITVQVTAGPLLTNVASVSSKTTDPTPGNQTDTEVTVVGTASGSLTVTIADDLDPVQPNGIITYQLTATTELVENQASAFRSVLAPETTFVSFVPPADVAWVCTTPAVGSSGTVECLRPSWAPDSVSMEVTVQVGGTVSPGTVLENTASITVESGGRDLVATDVEETGVVSPATLSAVKTVIGDFTPGGFLTYELVVTNGGPAAQFDNPGAELTDVLPDPLELISAVANLGSVVADTNSDTVTWNGALAVGQSVTITITAVLPGSAEPGTTIANQAILAFDADGDGVNEATAVSDDPDTGDADDPTSFIVGSRIEIVEIPTASTWGLLALALLLALAAQSRLRGRSSTTQ